MLFHIKNLAHHSQAAEQAAARGMGSSGLSQDAMNKIAIAGLSQRGNLEPV
ncbi:hypothetical protein ACT4UM_00380 [Bacillus sp. SS-TM]